MINRSSITIGGSVKNFKFFGRLLDGFRVEIGHFWSIFVDHREASIKSAKIGDFEKSKISIFEA